VLSPVFEDQHRAAREARLELCMSNGPLPEGIPLHVKVDTGMGRWGFRDVATTGANVVGLMSHLASADSDPAFTELQIARFGEVADAHPGLTRHLANSAGILRYPAALFDAGRPGLALYGLSPFGADPADDGLVPVLSWRSAVAQVKQLGPGESTGYNRRFVAAAPTWIGIVPAGYADGWRRGLTGTEVLVAGERRKVVGTISMDSFAVELPAPVEPGTPVTLIGDGLLAEEHAARLGTITYELACGIDSSPERARRVVV
jgi:alanine racemase